MWCVFFIHAQNDEEVNGTPQYQTVLNRFQQGWGVVLKRTFRRYSLNIEPEWELNQHQ